MLPVSLGLLWGPVSFAFLIPFKLSRTTATPPRLWLEFSFPHLSGNLGIRKSADDISGKKMAGKVVAPGRFVVHGFFGRCFVTFCLQVSTCTSSPLDDNLHWFSYQTIMNFQICRHYIIITTVIYCVYIIYVFNFNDIFYFSIST